VFFTHSQMLLQVFAVFETRRMSMQVHASCALASFTRTLVGSSGDYLQGCESFST
jgi:hypothetical protein